MGESVYIVNGARTPIGSFLGSLSSKTAPELGATAIKAVLERANQSATQKIQPDAINEIYMGCVITAGVGQAPARQAMIHAGIPVSTGATTVGKVCGSGMKAVMIGRNEIMAGEADLIIAGGMESMSQTPYVLKSLRKGAKMGHQELQDSMILDGLWDPYTDVHMGNCAERCVEQYHFTREAMDAYALTSYQRALSALDNHLFEEEIVPVSFTQHKGDEVFISEDEGPRKAKPEKMSQLKPAFEKTGSVTAANASSINDGAAALLLASESAVKRYGLTPMARIVASTTHSQDPTWFTTAPIGAIQKALVKANLQVSDIDLYEINEAFAAVSMAAIQDLKLDPDKINVRGGAIALGHPLGSSGARLLVTLIYALKQLKKRYGLATLCIGGGEATAMVLENLMV